MRVSILGLAAPLFAFGLASSTQAFALGTRADGSPTDPNSTANVPVCGGTLLYVKSGAAHAVGVPLILTKDFVTAALPNTAATGQPVYFSAQNFTAADQYGWVFASGICPMKVSLATAAGPLYITGAGTIGVTQANGKQIVGAQALIGSTATFTKASCKTVNGATAVKLPNTDGIYTGLAVSGTGIAGGTTVADVDAGGSIITLSAAATANGSVTLTFTHTGYVIGVAEGAHVQPQIV